jgi:hypothetical protein
MQLVKPLPFDEAVDKLGSKSLIGSALMSAEWRDVPVALRERAFFSSQVESARVLQRGRDGIADFLQSNRETLPDGQTALKTGSRADFVKQMQDFLKTEGIERTDGGLKDLAGEKRLGLIFDTQTRQANDYGYWREGQDADVLDAFPAQRFIRVLDVKDPRDAHTAYEDQVYLKSDPIWTRINDDFGVPWGPWGWGCGHDVEDVSREEAEELGLLTPGQAVQPDEKNFNENLKASTKNLDPDLLEKLKTEFGDQIQIDGDTITWAKTIKTQQFAPAKPLNPPPTGTLEDALKASGMDQPQAVTEAHVRRFIEELTEANPKQLSQVVTSTKGGDVLQQQALQADAQRFLDLIPPDRVAGLHKLDLALKSVSGENGHYSPGRGITIGTHLTGVERARVVFHELTHWLHLNGPQWYKDSIREHFQARTQGEKAKALPGYGSRGKKDNWYDAYAGRIYPNSLDSTQGDGLEVPTRYLETLAEPAKLAKLWIDDTFRETMIIALRILF